MTFKSVAYLLFVALVIIKVISHVFGLGYISLWLVFLPLILLYGWMILLFLLGFILIVIGIIKNT